MAESTGAYSKIGPWYRSSHGETICEMKRGSETFIFDPPNILFLAGHRLRIVDPESDRPVMEVEQFDGKIRRYPMALAASASSDSGASGGAE